MSAIQRDREIAPATFRWFDHIYEDGSVLRQMWRCLNDHEGEHPPSEYVRQVYRTLGTADHPAMPLFNAIPSMCDLLNRQPLYDALVDAVRDEKANRRPPYLPSLPPGGHSSPGSRFREWPPSCQCPAHPRTSRRQDATQAVPWDVGVAMEQVTW